MSCPKVIKVTTARQGPPGIGLPSGESSPGQYVRKLGTAPYAYELAPLSGGGTGTVTSVGLTVPAGFDVTGAPVTGSGDLGLVFAAGYSLPTTSKQTGWDTAAALAGTAVQPTALSTALSSKADLIGGVVPTSQIPAIAISDYLGAVGSQAAMLALVGQRGDWCLRTDQGAFGQWILSGDNAALLTNWVMVTVPVSPVQSVNGQTGVVALGASDVGALGVNALAAPPAIGSTTPAAGSFTALAASASMLLPGTVPGTPAAGHIYRTGNRLFYRDSTATEQTLLYGAGNLANLSDLPTARTNLGLTGLATASPGGGLTIQSGSLLPIDCIALVCTNNDETGATGNAKAEKRLQRAFTIIGCYWECGTAGSTSSQAMPYLKPASTGIATNLLTGNAMLAASANYIDVTANLTGTLTGVAGDAIGVNLNAVGTGAKGHILTIIVRYS